MPLGVKGYDSSAKPEATFGEEQAIIARAVEMNLEMKLDGPLTLARNQKTIL